MQLEHNFTVPVGVDEAFRVLRDIERIGPCMPGATIMSVEGDEFTGKVKVKVGPMQVTYQGTARFIEVDEDAHSATIEAKGKEARGPGTASATITATCTDANGVTDVKVRTDLAVTGKPAQFGRGVMADVGDKLLGQFASCLAEELAGKPETSGEPAEPAPGESPASSPEAPEAAVDAAVEAAGEEPAAGAGAAAAAVAGQPAADTATGGPQPAERRTSDTIDLLDVAGAPVLKRVAPVAIAVVVLWMVIRIMRRRRAG
jgi:uncharacterized protein